MIKYSVIKDNGFQEYLTLKKPLWYVKWYTDNKKCTESYTNSFFVSVCISIHVSIYLPSIYLLICLYIWDKTGKKNR